MGLSCSCYDYDTGGWSWYNPHEGVLKTAYSRKCCSCGSKVKPGETVLFFSRIRPPRTDIEERIWGDEVQLSDWHMCEPCGDMFWSLTELGFCITLGVESMRELTREYAEIYGPKKG